MAVYPEGYDVNSFVSCAGERYRTEYIGEPAEGGFINLVPNGRTDLQEMYNEAAEGCDINVIVARFNNGDPSALFVRQGSYGDIVGAPKSLTEAYQIIQHARAAFDELPDDNREKFSSFNEFLGTVGAKSWFDKIAEIKEVEVSKDAESE